VVEEDGTLRRALGGPFGPATVEPASAAHLEAVQRASAASLSIGSWESCGVGVDARLRAQGFGRHTFLCGQSGSGKTYALGVILEQLLLNTELRMVVLDPNADFVRLGQTRPEAPPDATARLAATEVRVLGADATGAEPLRMRFATMPRQAQAAVLRLDPLADRGEYNHFLHMMDESGLQEVGQVLQRLREGGPDGQSLAQRLENLGLPQWEVWAGEQPSAAEVVRSDTRLTVLDLSGFHSPHEPHAVSLDLIESLWTDRESRTPTMIVLDEAHNLCPAEPSGPIQAALVERLIQIAAEGRKYGLWLLLSTQRPSKIHPQVLSQCDNLVLMRMNSPGDIAELAEVFGYAPLAMLRSSKFFVQGEALVAGGFVPVPGIIRMGARLTYEGGSDVPVPV
jgi:DNA helicase HerA-like ATPase